MPSDPASRRAEFRRMHASGCFVIPNPWDVGSARFLQHLGFLEDLGVQRISVGGGLARAAWGAFMRAAREIAEQGTFRALEGAATHAELQAFFGEELARRH